MCSYTRNYLRRLPRFPIDGSAPTLERPALTAPALSQYPKSTCILVVSFVGLLYTVLDLGGA